MPDYIAYYRVSTDKQGARGLGMEAQREAVSRFIAGRGQLLEEFTEVESGKRHTNRPKLLAALAMCEERGATLVIAKLDRLARNVHFISGLMNSKVEFVAVDMPTASRLTIHILAAVAEHEREMISTRTKDALAAARKRGQQLGSPRAAETIAQARAAIYSPQPAPQVAALIETWHREGKSFRQIARDLNHLGNRTPRGGEWFAQTVKNLLAATATIQRGEEQLETLLLEGLESGEPVDVSAEYIQQKRAELIKETAKHSS